MILPTIHLNGSSKESLIDAWCQAGLDVGKALASLADTCPNPRDYYPQGPDAHRQAMKEYKVRVDKLQSVRLELMALASALDD